MNLKIIRTVAVTLAVIMLLSLTACGSEKTTVNSDDTKIEQIEKGVKVTQTAAKAVQTEKYETADFSITIPKGWKVTTGGANIYHSIRISDPNEPLNGMFILLKAECLLHSQAGKDAWKSLNRMGNTQAALLANAPVLKNPSTENFYKIFTQYADFVTQMDSSYSGYIFPKYDNFTVTDRFESNSNLKNDAIDDELLRATFIENGKEGEGLFSASVVDFGSLAISDGTVVNYQLKPVDGGYYMAYNIVAITAAKDTFIEWESVLTDCMKTLMYNPLLDTFLVVVDSGSFTKAAEKLFVSPTAVMKQMNSLEEHLTFKLIERTPTGIRLTPAGEIIYRDAKFIMDCSEKSIASAKAVIKTNDTIFCVGTSLLNPAKPFMDLWYRLNQDFPDYKLHLVPFEDNHEGILSEIKSLGEKFDFLIGVCDSKAWLSLCNFLPLGRYKKWWRFPANILCRKKAT